LRSFLIREQRSLEVGIIKAGFGFVSYKNYDSVKEVMDDYDKHSFKGKWVECKMSNPKDQSQQGEFDSITKQKSNKSSPHPDNHMYDDYYDYPSDNSHHHSSHKIGQGNYSQYNMNYYQQEAPSGYQNFQPRYPVQGQKRPQAHHIEAQIGSSNAVGYEQMYGYNPAPNYGYHHPQSNVGYPMSNIQPGSHLSPQKPHIPAQSQQRQGQDVYINLNNQVAPQPVNPKLKTQGSAGPADLSYMKTEEPTRKMFPMMRAYSNQLEDYNAKNISSQMDINPTRKTLNRGGTLDLPHVGESSSNSQVMMNFNTRASDNPHPRLMFQNFKSHSFHPEDTANNRSPNMSPSRMVNPIPEKQYSPPSQQLNSYAQPLQIPHGGELFGRDGRTSPQQPSSPGKKPTQANI
jgi:hypothetical protein